MKITKYMLNRNPPEKDGIYLALRGMNQYCDSNLYIPIWDVMASFHFNKCSPLNYQGWLRIDTIPFEEFSQGPIPIRYHKNADSENDSVNVVLIVYKKTQDWNMGRNPYGISNAIYASNHTDEYLGWMDLEDIPIVLIPGSIYYLTEEEIEMNKTLLGESKEKNESKTTDK